MTSRHKLLYSFALIVSLVFFLIKGIQYAMLGTYLPLLLLVLVICLLYISRRKKKTASVLLKIWGFLVIFWSLLRIFFGIVDHFALELMENHLQENLGIGGTVLSLLFLYIGFYLISKKKRKSFLGSLDE